MTQANADPEKDPTHMNDNLDQRQHQRLSYEYQLAKLIDEWRERGANSLDLAQRIMGVIYLSHGVDYPADPGDGAEVIRLWNEWGKGSAIASVLIVPCGPLRTPRAWYHRSRDPRQFETVRAIVSRDEFSYALVGDDDGPFTSDVAPYTGPFCFMYYTKQDELVVVRIGKTGEILREVRANG